MRFLLKLWRLSLYVPLFGNLAARVFPQEIRIRTVYDQNRSALVYTETDARTGIVLHESVAVIEDAARFEDDVMVSVFGEKSGSNVGSCLDWFPHGGSRYGGL